MKRLLFFLFITLSYSINVAAQPYVDAVSFNYQTFSSTNKDNSDVKNRTDDYFLNLFLPKEFKNGNVLLLRLNGELMNSKINYPSSDNTQLGAVSLPIGFQFLSTNKKWKTLVMIIPKVASDFETSLSNYDFQLGAIGMENYMVNEKLKIKLGLYYNREAFGNFFMPLVGIDWKATDKLYFYGVLPSNYKMEYNLVRNKLYCGLGFKSFTRSFRLSANQNHDYIRYDEEELKLFIEEFVYKKILLFGEIGYTLGKNPIRYLYDTKDREYFDGFYNELKPYPIFNIGIAYRIRTDLFKEEEKK